MRPLTPVVWREGMHLAQHHFQLRDRYFQESSALAFSSLFFRPYGLAGLELDHDALLNGTVAIIHARGVMPDGLPFSFPDDPVPDPLPIRDLFSPTSESEVVSLAIPPLRRGRPNCLLEPEAADGRLRYTAEEARVADETTGGDEKTVTLGRKNFRLALAGPELEDTVSLPLARVRRDRSGSFVYDDQYVPPCIRIGASRRILELLLRLTETMEAKAATLAGERAGGGGVEFAAEEIASFWLSHTLHSSLAPLRHHLEAKGAHPAELFAELLRLGGALCTFSMEAHPRDLPLYDHDDLESSFGSLERHIRTHLDIAFPRRAVRVALEPMREPYFWSGQVHDPRLITDGAWFLAATGEGSRERLISRVPRNVHICAAQHIRRLVDMARSGLPLEHVPSPPSAISPRLGTEYFRILREGDDGQVHPCWRAMEEPQEERHAGAVGVWAPEAVADLELEILVVRER